MAGLVPAIHALTKAPQGVDPRDKPGDDGGHGILGQVLRMRLKAFEQALNTSSR
jgi:hypothetical protein